MIEDSEFAQQVVGFLTAHAKKMAGKLTGKAADAVTGEIVEAAGHLWDKVKAKLTGAAAKEAVADFEAAPDDADNQAALRKEIRKAAEGDPAFATELRELVQTIEARGGRDAIVQTANVEGDHSPVTQIAGSGNRVG